jgi:aspartyl-tRNA(Asn)/glutamyl-tRNA(Gln) amidotransferase subunit C
MQLHQYEAMTKINLTEEERVWISGRTDKIINDWNKINEIKTEGVIPLVTVLPLVNTLREDVTDKKFTREEILTNAPMEYDSYFQVPKTV